MAARPFAGVAIAGLGITRQARYVDEHDNLSAVLEAARLGSPTPAWTGKISTGSPLVGTGRGGDDPASGLGRLGGAARHQRRLDRRRLPIRDPRPSRRRGGDRDRPLRDGVDRRWQRRRSARRHRGDPSGVLPPAGQRVQRALRFLHLGPVRPGRPALPAPLSGCAGSDGGGGGVDPQQRPPQPGGGHVQPRPLHRRGRAGGAEDRRSLYAARPLPRQRGRLGVDRDHRRARPGLPETTGHRPRRRHGVGAAAVRQSAPLRGGLGPRRRRRPPRFRDGRARPHGRRRLRGLRHHLL